MSWVIRKLERWGGHPPAMVPRYFTGAGFSHERRHAIRFSYRHWAEGMLATLRRCGVGTTAKIVLVRRPKKTRCLDAHCPCLKVPT